MTVSKDIKFYDTCSLLLLGEDIFEQEEKFVISSITLNELEHIKNSANKDADIKYSARLLLNLFNKYPDKYEVVIHKNKNEHFLLEGLEINNDTKILSDVLYYDANIRPDEVIFVTNDLALKHIANMFLGDGMIESVHEDQSYSGYKEIEITKEELANFYEHISHNWYNLLIGEYLILKQDNQVVDIRVWNGFTHRLLSYDSFCSDQFGKISPYKNDPYQKILFDTLSNNKLSLIKGPAGSGKSLLSLAFLMSELEHNRLDRIVVFCNTVATANSAKLGFLPGSKNEKLLDSQIGNLLISKFGGKMAIESLINREQLILLPMSDIRGYDTSDMRAGIYISEAQNLDRTLMKLALQRVGQDCICIIDGDDKTQVDDVHFSGNNNGMKRVSKVYRGTELYGEVELKNIYRSKIALIAEQM